MQQDITDIFRERIVKKSIELLRSHGIADEEIKMEILKDFSINGDTLERLMKSK